MTEPTVNIPLLRKAVEWAEAEAAKPVELCQWEQGVWQTTPETQVWARNRLIDKPQINDQWVIRAAAKTEDCGTCYCIAGYVEVLHDLPARGDKAAELLGISRGAAFSLFDGDNTIEDVRRIAESIAGERL